MKTTQYPKDTVMQIRLSHDEKALIESKARGLQMTTSQFVAYKLLGKSYADKRERRSSVLNTDHQTTF